MKDSVFSRRKFLAHALALTTLPLFSRESPAASSQVTKKIDEQKTASKTARLCLMPLSEVRRYIRVPEIEYFDTLKNRLCLFCEGNLKINGGLILDWGRSKNDFFDRRIVKTSKGDFSRASTTNTVTWTGNLLVGEHACALFVTGNLTVSRGILNTNINGGPALQVKGLTRAGDLLAGSANIFLGEVKLYGGLYAYYNRGEVYIESLKADFICSWDNAFLNIRKLDVDACQVCMDHEHLGIMKRKPARK